MGILSPGFTGPAEFVLVSSKGQHKPTSLHYCATGHAHVFFFKEPTEAGEKLRGQMSVQIPPARTW